MPNAEALPTVYLVHPDRHERDRLGAVIARHGFSVREFASVDAFLSARTTCGRGCLVIDVPGPPAYELLEQLGNGDAGIPAILIGDGGGVPAAVRAMRAGASMFINKPYANSVLVREIRRLSV